MKKIVSLSTLSSWAALVSACAVQPVGLEEPALHPADERAGAATVPALTWQAEQHGSVTAPVATSEHRHEHHAHDANDTRASGDGEHEEPGTSVTTGTVTDIDHQSARVTLDHENVPGLMPAMEMAFDIEPALLEGLYVGMEVEFRVREGERPGRFVVTEIEPLSEAPPTSGHPEGRDNDGHAH